MSTNKEFSGVNATLRSLLGEMKLPKEALFSALAQASETKKEVLQALIKELKGPLFEKRMLSLLQSALDGMELHIDATVTINSKKNEKSSKSKAKPKKP